jgi:hypothetical protein
MTTELVLNNYKNSPLITKHIAPIAAKIPSRFFNEMDCNEKREIAPKK